MMLGQGDRIAGYEVEAVIARGGMGVVYRAHQAGLGRSVALKVIAGERAEDPLFRARFVREARLAASLDHPNVIPVFEAGDDGGELFIAMRLVDGADLERLIGRSGPLEVALACGIVGQAAAGLHAAHRAGLVHRDVKPANILLAGPADDPHVYVSDFGVAKSSVPAAELTSASEWVGTPGYAAPEQVRGGQVDARADVYALGCVLLAALTRPAREPGAGLRPALPAAIDAVIDRATATAPSARFQSARELADALAAACQTVVADAAGGSTESGRRAADGGRPDVGQSTTRPGRATTTLSAGTRRSGREPAVDGDGGRSAQAGRLGGTAGAGPRGLRKLRPGCGFAVGFGVIVAGVIGVALSQQSDRHPPGSTGPPRVATVVPAATPAASGGGDTVFCGAAACRQGGQTVLVPIEGGSCVRDGMSGSWTRLDAGAPEPMVICLPVRKLPRVSVAVAVPTLTGGRLDHAETALDRLGIPYRTSGGGLFGIISTDNWTVCATRPSAGATLATASEVTVFVEHGC